MQHFNSVAQMGIRTVNREQLFAGQLFADN